MGRFLAIAAAAVLTLFAASACARRHTLTRVEQGDRDGVLHLGNFAEPRELDPQLAIGIPEANILYALEEGLVTADRHDFHITPGVAESWEVSPDGMTYTFHLRADARWSNGAPLTAPDFVASFRRVLDPGLGAELAYYVWPVRNAEAFNRGRITDFGQVGFHAPDAHTLRVDLEHPTPYLLYLALQRTWFPVYLPAVEKTGQPYDRSNQGWTRPGHYVGNGPFVLTDWQPNQLIAARKNPSYWNAAHIRLNEVRYYPIGDSNTEENAFRAGLLHKTYSGNLPPAKIDVYRRTRPGVYHSDPYLGVYYYMLNTTRPPLDDVRVRRALAMCIDRASIVQDIARGGQQPAGNFTPPGTAGYTARAQIPYDPAAARKLLADAGHPGGKGLPPLEIMFNTSDLHLPVAEAVQQMWKRELGVDVQLSNQEWKVYLDSRRTMNYTITRAGWIGSVDPSFFLENFLSGGDNNRTGFASPEYDRLIHAAQNEHDPAARDGDFQRAEAILLDAAPVAPVYFYTNYYLLSPSVRGWSANPIDYHPFADLSLVP